MSYYYIATPYSAYPAGIEAAFHDACKATAEFIKRGIPVYSPIAHTHPVAMAGGMDPLDHTIWLPADQPLMDAARGLIVVQMDGWDKSKGIAFEIEAFKTAGKDVVYCPWPIPDELTYLF